MIPYSKYPGLSPLFLEFLKGLPSFYPDPPTIDAAAARGQELLASGRPARVPASAFRCRSVQAQRMAEDLAAGRAVAVSAGQQVGLFTGPLFTLVKAFDAIRLAGELSRRGVPAVPVFWALTDDHDLQEIAQTARPTPEGAHALVLEGADRQNRQPVGRLRIPEGVRTIVEAFRPDVRDEEGGRILQAFATRSAPGTLYGEAFIEMLLDLVDPRPLLVVEPLAEGLRAPTVALFLEAAKKADALRETLSRTEAKLRAEGKPVPAPVPEGFSFFAIDGQGRRRIEDLASARSRVEAGEVLPSADVITRPVLKSYLYPMAASVLGAAEIAYHAQSLPLFGLFDVTPPVLIPRSHLVLRGPAERRLAELLGVAEEDLLLPPPPSEAAPVPAAGEVERAARAADGSLESLAAPLESLDASLSGALETARKKIAYQFDQLADRARKAAERKGDVAGNRRKRLASALTPGGIPSERVYPPLSTMLAWGRGSLDAIDRAAGSSNQGAVVVDVGLGPDEGESAHGR